MAAGAHPSTGTGAGAASAGPEASTSDPAPPAPATASSAPPASPAAKAPAPAPAAAPAVIIKRVVDNLEVQPMVVFISNIPSGVTDEKLRQVFERVDPVERAWVMVNPAGASKHYGAKAPAPVASSPLPSSSSIPQVKASGLPTPSQCFAPRSPPLRPLNRAGFVEFKLRGAATRAITTTVDLSGEAGVTSSGPFSAPLPISAPVSGVSWRLPASHTFC